MTHKIRVLPQYLLQQPLTNLMRGLAESTRPWLKNFLISRFIKRYDVNMQEAIIENPLAYPTFNQFFIRQLKSHLRPIATEPLTVASPVDGIVAQMGRINKNQLLQAKQYYFDLETLLGGEKDLARHFYDGNFATLYLAPKNYHRVHMPITGKLEKTIYVPGKLFSVNHMTSEIIPNLYSRNERLICVFSTEAGTMVVILVGAMIVGSVQTVWMDQPIRGKHILSQIFSANLLKGAELGHFKMGSTVILLFEKNKVKWSPSLTANSPIKYGELIGSILA